ncbi:MAG: hypothetical protein PHE96_04935 [Methylococcales bacterium]|nr:hypothetical protein [Methylococcales bacterium]
MPQNSFYSEWITIGHHRIFIECRDGFPSSDERFIAEVSAKVVDHNSSGSARVVSIFYDDKACVHCVTVASTDKADTQIESALTTVLHNIFNNGNSIVNVEIVKRGNESSDHYNHMEHLSISTKVAKR